MKPMNRKSVLLLIVVLVMGTAVLAACGGSSAELETVEVTRVVTESEVESGPAAVGSEGSAGDSPVAPDSGPKAMSTSGPLATPAAEMAAMITSGESDAFAGAPADRGVAEVADAALNQNSSLTAGEVDDNAGWDDYLLYLRNYQGAAVIELTVSPRHQIWVQDAQGNPVLSALVSILANGQEVARLRTHSDGRVYFFPRVYNVEEQEFTVAVSANGRSQQFTIPANSAQSEWNVTLPDANQSDEKVNLDVLFLIDATGSMSDEIQQLKDNIRAIADRVATSPTQPDVRFGMVTYRDQGDDYVTQVTDFTPEVERFAQVLAAVQAEGGGDYPEDLNEALSQAIHQPEWRVDNTVSLVFLVADAPPHLDYGQQNHYGVEVLEATERGIKIYPIASSGLDSQGEYVFRQLAQITGGRFIFLTYGASGPGSTGTETEFQVSDYTVSSLDDLVVKIIEEELAHLSQ
jgi:Mg-chelatase subunit ChlD